MGASPILPHLAAKLAKLPSVDERLARKAPYFACDDTCKMDKDCKNILLYGNMDI